LQQQIPVIVVLLQQGNVFLMSNSEGGYSSLDSGCRIAKDILVVELWLSASRAINNSLGAML
jgi:hypothetical protein